MVGWEWVYFRRTCTLPAERREVPEPFKASLAKFILKKQFARVPRIDSVNYRHCTGGWEEALRSQNAILCWESAASIEASKAAVPICTTIRSAGTLT